MDKIYNVEDIKNRIKDSIDYYDSRIKLWIQVERVHKKDGSDFAALKRNFTNCIFKSDYGWDHNLTVFGHDSKGHYIDDYINIGEQYTWSGELNENWLGTADKIENAIKERIKHYTDLKERAEHELAICDDVATEFTETVKAALDKVHDICKQNDKYGDTTLYYACRDYMQSLY